MCVCVCVCVCLLMCMHEYCYDVAMYCLLSFLDDAFRKNLESALRFGNPLLVQVGETEVVCVVLNNAYT